MHLSPLYSGRIRGAGPRYCPSIEDKVVKFPDRDGHHLWIEPEGRDTDEMYVNGLSTSLPEDVQMHILATVPGLEEAEMLRPGYAVEYDFVYPDQLRAEPGDEARARPFPCRPDQRHHRIRRGGGAGASRRASTPPGSLRGEPAVVLRRWEAYVGVMIDDLVTLGTEEPYRMFTSQSEYRLLLAKRQCRRAAHAAGGGAGPDLAGGGRGVAGQARAHPR